MTLLPILCLLCAAAILIALTIIDLRTWLLPNVLVAPLALLGIAFHWATDFAYADITLIALGGFAGFGVMYLIRFFANRAYGQDALGLGDVKLLGAGGLWLGPSDVMLAMSVGAFFALIHGLGVALAEKKKTGTMPALNKLKIPAGPGFCAGLALVAFFAFL